MVETLPPVKRGRGRPRKIEQLEVITDKISSLQAKLAQQNVAQSNTAEATTNTAPSASGQVNFTDLTTVNLVALAQIETKGGLIVDKDAQFNGKTTFQLIDEFNGQANFKSDVNFDKQPTFNSDAGGTAVIKKYAQKVQIKFDQAYSQTPIVVANWSVDSDKPEDQIRLFDANYNYLITKVDQNGFWIYLNKPAAEDLKMNWLATSIKDAKISTSEPVLSPGLE